MDLPVRTDVGDPEKMRTMMMKKKTTTTTMAMTMMMLRMIADVYEAVFGLYAESVGKLLAIADGLPGALERERSIDGSD